MYEARQNRERVSRTISSPMQKKLQNVETKFKFSNYIVQRIPVFRVEPSDNEYKSTDESDGHFINKDHSLNISIGYPDHALYYSEMKDGYIIRWELDDNYWTNVLFPKLKRQREGSADNPTFNDISQVGLKLEIPSKMLDELWPNLVYKETYSDHGALADTNTNSIKNRSEQVQKLVERLTTAKLINPNQEKKILSDYSDNNDGWLNKTW